MAATRRRQRRKSRNGAGRFRGLALAIAAIVIAGVGLWYFGAGLRQRPAGPVPDAPPVPKAGTAASAAKGAGPAKPSGKAAEAPERFEFYEMLPDAEVRVGNESPPPRPNPLPPVSTPGTYVVQAGAFTDFAEADKVKARLALLGVVSEIQKVDANGTTFHRVRVGPIENLDELNRVRNSLRQNRIDFLVIPVGD